MQNIALDPPPKRSGRFGSRHAARLQMLDRSGSLVAQVPEQDVAEFASRAATQRVQDRLVFAHRFTPALALAGEIGGIAYPANPPRKVCVRALERRIARGFDDLLVDQLV